MREVPCGNALSPGPERWFGEISRIDSCAFQGKATNTVELKMVIRGHPKIRLGDKSGVRMNPLSLLSIIYNRIILKIAMWRL